MSSTSEKWETLASQRRAKQLGSIPKEWLIERLPSDLNVTRVPESLLSPEELEITNTVDLAILLEKLSKGVWSSVQVVKAFSKRAVIAHQLTNCLTEIFIDAALERAKELDEYLAREGKPIGPLHGLPISLKDQVRIEGLETIMGYVSNIGKVSDHNATIVDILLDAGAVPYVRTNVSQTLWWGETHNNVFGRTLNPNNRSLTAGGSSGGEGALIAMRGSPLGIGTDIGGSVRIPSHFTGIYALRPGSHRFPYAGLLNTAEGQDAIHSVTGPMATSLSALAIFTRAILQSSPAPWNRDPMCLRMPWRQEEYELSEHGGKGGKLCFGVMWDNGVVKPTPPVRRAMEIVIEAVKAQGHTVIEWENYMHEEIHRNTHAIYDADGGNDFIHHASLSDEPLLTTMLPTESEYSPPNPTDPPFGHLYGPVPRPINPPGLTASPLEVNLEKHYPENTSFESSSEPPVIPPLEDIPSRAISAYELWSLHKERRGLRKRYLDAWEATKARTGSGRAVDAILCPAAAYPAPPHGYNSDGFYTSLWNALDYTATVFPVTVVDASLDVKEERERFHNHEDEFIWSWYDARLFKNAPVGVQLVGRTHEEEGVLGMTEVVDQAVKQYTKKLE